MSKRIFLSPSNQDGNHYAYGNTTEDVQCGKIAAAAEKALKRCGFEVKTEQYDTMQNRVAHSNAWGADMHLPIHTNACNGSVGGTRIFYGSGGQAAAAMLAALRDLTPGKSDGMAREDFYEITHAKAITVYVEAEFHDVPAYAKWIIEHTTELGEGICKGVCAYYGIKYIQPQSTANEHHMPTNSLKKGAALTLTNEPLYVSASVTLKSGTVTGTYYVWSADVVNGRIRITNTSSRVGITGQVTGWIDVPKQAVYHKVVKGDTLSAIARKYGTTVDAIVAYNKTDYPTITPNFIVVGWQLRVC